MTGGALFDVEDRRRRGRVRRGLDADAAAARAAGVELHAGALAALRVLADALDDLDRTVYGSGKPYDRVPLSTMARTFADVHRAVIGGDTGGDPFEQLVAQLVADAESSHAADTGPAL